MRQPRHSFTGCICITAACALAAGCHSDRTTRADDRPTTLAPPARINHVVLFDLREGTDEDTFLADCRDRLSRIPGVTSVFCGRHFDTGRDKVVDTYDIGLYVGLESADAYAAYLTHPDHLGLVNRWKSSFNSYWVYDIEDTLAP